MNPPLQLQTLFSTSVCKKLLQRLLQTEAAAVVQTATKIKTPKLQTKSVAMVNLKTHNNSSSNNNNNNNKDYLAFTWEC